MPDSLLIPAAAIQSDPTRRSSRANVFLRSALPAATLAAMLSTTGCLFQKKPVKVFVPQPVQRPVPAPLKPPPDPGPPELAIQMELVIQADDGSDLDLAGLGPVIPDFAPPAPPPQAVRPRNPVAAGPKPAPVPAVPETPAPKIVQLLPAEEQRAITKELDDILARDERALQTLARRNLAADQRDRMAQIREYLTQAKQAREQDLVTAVNLARHADTLAKDLLDRLP
jgi:hypothetical protein